MSSSGIPACQTPPISWQGPLAGCATALCSPHTVLRRAMTLSFHPSHDIIRPDGRSLAHVSTIRAAYRLVQPRRDGSRWCVRRAGFAVFAPSAAPAGAELRLWLHVAHLHHGLRGSTPTPTQRSWRSWLTAGGCPAPSGGSMWRRWRVRPAFRLKRRRGRPATASWPRSPRPVVHPRLRWATTPMTRPRPC